MTCKKIEILIDENSNRIKHTFNDVKMTFIANFMMIKTIDSDDNIICKIFDLNKISSYKIYKK